MVGRLRTHPSLTRLMLESSRLYACLEAQVGLGTGWNQSGALWVAASADRMVHLLARWIWQQAQGVETHVISVAEAGQARWPLMRHPADLVGGVWLPNDAKANPTDITQALARGAQQGRSDPRDAPRSPVWMIDRGPG